MHSRPAFQALALALAMPLAPAAALILGATAPDRPARATEASPPLQLVDVGGGEPVCGLGREFHAGRRKALAEQLKTGVVLMRGLPDTRDYAAFQQDKNFWYLTGIESPQATLVIDLDKQQELLFLPEPNKQLEGWEGERWDALDAWVEPLTGFRDIRPNGELMKVLEELLPEGRTVWISHEPHIALSGCYDRAEPYDRAIARDPLDGRLSREQKLEERLEAKFKVEVKDMQRTLALLRRTKTPEEIAALERAARAGANAMVEAMRSTSPGRGEWELAAVMDFVHKREGAAGPGYMPIVGSGRNSCVLHYSANRRRMQAGEILLIDYAPEFDHGVVDITRTWPVSGRFSERQAKLYDAVLAAQQAGIDAARPGVALGVIEAACSKVLTESGFQKLRRHGACHWVGMEVHDVGDYAQPLVPGCAFTIEPGLYDEQAGIGVRIEDVVVITEDGCRVITAGVPRDRAAIEALISDKGLLDELPRNE